MQDRELSLIFIQVSILGISIAVKNSTEIHMSREALLCVLQECFIFYSLVGVATDSYRRGHRI
jgi:hypothetical protein